MREAHHFLGYFTLGASSQHRARGCRTTRSIGGNTTCCGQHPKDDLHTSMTLGVPPLVPLICINVRVAHAASRALILRLRLARASTFSSPSLSRSFMISLISVRMTLIVTPETEYSCSFIVCTQSR